MPVHKMSDLIARPPQDFVSVLATEESLFLVGGQAVNLWALYYIERTSDLSPFVSRDLDVLGDRGPALVPRILQAPHAQIIHLYDEQ